MTKNFIGFADSDAFLKAIDRTRMVNLMVGRRSGRSDRHGVSIDVTEVTMSQVRDDEVLYFECVSYRWNCVAGTPLLQDTDKPRRLAAEAFAAAVQYLDEHNLSWREALLSMPSSYVKMSGHATFLRWNEKAESYSYVATESPTA